MPNTKRQNFIIKIEQCINLLGTIDTYLMKIHLFCYGTDYVKSVSKIVKINHKSIHALKRFLKRVRGG